MNTDLKNAYKAVRKAEALENYSRSDQLELAPLDNTLSPQPAGYEFQFYDDEGFWYAVRHQQLRWGQSVYCQYGVISEWVSRVPGLYWMPGSEKIRQVSENIIETIGNIYALTPIGKSQVVIGGIGTLRFPPDIQNYHLVTYSTSSNASTGVPMLIAPDIWEHYQLEEGAAFDVGECQWRQMTTEWAQHFPSITGAVRGCLMVEEKNSIRNIRKKVATQIHPFSIMEYNTSQGELLHDFVFASAITNQPSYRDLVAQFFDSYRTTKERLGRYLTAGDIAEPMWDSISVTPQDLLKADQNAQSQLNVLLARIRGVLTKGKSIDAINLALINGYGDVASMQRLATQYVGIPAAWLPAQSSAAQFAIRLIDKCIELNRLDALVDAIIIEKPELIS